MKRITPQNWLEPDLGGASAGLDPSAWREALLAIRLHEQVPAEIAALFDTARASMLYGLFFAPLVTLGVQQCYWVLDAAARTRCAQRAIPVAVRDRQGKEHALSFSHNLRQLVEQGVIAGADAPLWKQAGELRDWAVSPGQGVGPEHALTALGRAASLLNRLFA